ncbi:MAG: undecaprenyl-phosphate glucose phosphotransferase [Anaerolineae bacterium]|nr:undecaprenyl-phosphate glucose phosphotransferase [Anaerolineae bacterium]
MERNAARPKATLNALLLPGRVQDFLRGLQFLIDAAAITGAFAAGYWARQRFPLFAVPLDPPPFESYLSLFLIHASTLLILFFLNRLYHQKRAVSRIDLLYNVAASVSVGVVMTSGISTILLKGTGILQDYPRQMILYVWLLTIVFVMIGRELHHWLVVWLRVLGPARDRVLIVGDSDIAQAIVQQIQFNPQLGYVIVGAVNIHDTVLEAAPVPTASSVLAAEANMTDNGDQRLSKMTGQPNVPKRPKTDSYKRFTDSYNVAGVPVIGRPEDLPNLIDELSVDEVIIALPEASRLDLMQITAWCQRGKANVKIFPDLFAYMQGTMTVDELGGIPLINVRDVALRGWKLTLKRGLDIVGATGGLIMLSPLMLLLAILIKLESPGPVFFSQERAGLDGRPFPMLKFRSMRKNAEAKGPGWTVKGDPRVTRIGKFIRATNLDELPNLINVLFGHMSLVGPRPEQTHFVQEFREKIPRYMERHREKAGMTGWAQVNGLRGDTSIEERIKYDLWYVENWSLWLDIKILIRTVWQTALRRSPNAY